MYSMTMKTAHALCIELRLYYTQYININCNVQVLKLVWGQDSEVSVRARLWLGNLGFESQQEQSVV